MTKPATPEQWAIRISHILAASLGEGRFPVDVPMVATELSRQLFPDDPVSTVKGAELPGFEGALIKAGTTGKGWGIFYNNGIESRGRINFTLGHEFGHYLLHREDYPEGFQCGQKDMVGWDSEYRKVEHQANVFAANLLMPLDDYRTQIPPGCKPDLDALGAVAERYQVSLIAGTLRWLEYTERRAVLVVARDGYILWSRASDPAFRSGVYFKTVGQPPIEVPSRSLASDPGIAGAGTAKREHGEGSWFRDEGCEELALVSDRYDFTVSLLHLCRVPSLA